MKLSTSDDYDLHYRESLARQNRVRRFVRYVAEQVWGWLLPMRRRH